MGARKPPFRSRDAERSRRAAYASVARNKRLPPLPPSKPAAAAPPPAAETPPPPASTAAVPWGWETDGREIPPPGRRFFSSGVQDPPAAENAPVEALTGGDGNINIPATADVAGALGASATVIRAAKEPPAPDADTLAAGAEQRPAAYRFGLRRDGKIDVLPEPPEPVDRGFALDTYRELVAKARELHERLKGTNSACRVCDSVEQLLTALGTRFDDLNAGVLLSRSRSIEADRAAFGDELFPDTIAMMDDTARTLRDLLASFPIVRRIEAEALALDLDRSVDAVPTIREQMAAIKTAAEKSGAVTPEAIGALTQNDAAIEDAIDPVVKRRLVADSLLVFRNFVGAVIGGIVNYGGAALGQARAGLGKLATKSWDEINNQLPKSIGATAALVPPLALVGLAVWLTDPVTGVAVTVATFKLKAKILNSIAHGEKPAKAKKKQP